MIGLNFKKGDIVARKSYNKDLLFIIDKILRTNNGESFAILKGLTKRVEASSALNDLDRVDRNIINKEVQEVDNRLDKLAEEYLKHYKRIDAESPYVYTGKILHLDGDRKYSEKSMKYYKKLGLNAIVKNIAESEQSKIVVPLLTRYNPDILVVTRA